MVGVKYLQKPKKLGEKKLICLPIAWHCAQPCSSKNN